MLGALGIARPDFKEAAVACAQSQSGGMAAISDSESQGFFFFAGSSGAGRL
jgi:hypothetical protein